MAEMLTARTAADLLGVDKRTILRMARDGKIRSFRTPGGQHRFRREEIERVAAGRESAPRPAVSTVENKRDEVETLNLEMQARRAKRELARMEAEDAAAERDAAAVRRSEELARKTALSEIRLRRDRERHERETARAQADAEHERQRWQTEIISRSLAGLPKDVPIETRAGVSEEVRRALAPFSPDDPQDVITTATTGATARALASWTRSKEIQQIVEDAEHTLPWDARAYAAPTDTQLAFRAAADAAIRALPPDAPLSKVRAAARENARKLADGFERRKREEQHRRSCASYADWARWCSVLEADRGAVRKAIITLLAELPVGCAESELRTATERAIAPFGKRKETTEHAEQYLQHVAAYIDKIGAPDGEWNLGDYFERSRFAERMTKNIRPELVKALLAGEIEDDQDAQDFIEQMVDFALELEE